MTGDHWCDGTRVAPFMCALGALAQSRERGAQHPRLAGGGCDTQHLGSFVGIRAFSSVSTNVDELIVLKRENKLTKILIVFIVFNFFFCLSRTM